MSCSDPAVSLTTEDGWYLGNVVELAVGVELVAGAIDGDDEDVAVLDETVGEVKDEAGVVPVDALLVPPQPAARTTTTSNPASPDTRIFFIGMPPFVVGYPRQTTQCLDFITLRPLSTLLNPIGTNSR